MLLCTVDTSYRFPLLLFLSLSLCPLSLFLLLPTLWETALTDGKKKLGTRSLPMLQTVISGTSAPEHRSEKKKAKLRARSRNRLNVRYNKSTMSYTFRVLECN